MEWYREQTIQLIDLFRARPALWDTSSVHYRNKRMKNEALEQISVKLKCPKEEIAKKICTLRVQFSRENVKVKRAREAGTVYNPKWFGYQLLRFLNDQSKYSTGGAGYASSAAGTSALQIVSSTTPMFRISIRAKFTLSFSFPPSRVDARSPVTDRRRRPMHYFVYALPSRRCISPRRRVRSSRRSLNFKLDRATTTGTRRDGGATEVMGCRRRGQSAWSSSGAKFLRWREGGCFSISRRT